ncbi:DNA sulfur modification protein DndB [Mycolicibacterium wolinskyi]|uniref:DNA sulfur modification protein DndB n=1 Tax=Mycolicibacterium wolinskyi TaxID=59750 RepID=UPI003BA869A8
MATTVPVIKGQMGSTEFYEAKMSARELVASTRAPRDMDGWANFSLEERLQRELNDKRVDDEIVPYLAKSSDRFFSSILVLICNADVTYESLSDIIPKGLPAAYKSVAKDIGFLTINGGELVVLDGQHRTSALGKVIKSKVDLGEFTKEVANDELAVIFVDLNESEHIRRIFNKINRNAKPTSRGDNIITSEDDGYAILTRWLLREGEPLGQKDAKGNLIVNWKSNTLADRSAQFTTISAVYDTVQSILAHFKMIEEFNEKKNVVRPAEERLDEAYEHVKDWWLAALHGMDAFKEALANPVEIPAMRKDGQKWSLLLKPAAHIVLFRALVRAVDLGLTLDEAIVRANKIDWNIQSEQWKDVLIAPNGRIIARNENYETAADLIAYLIAGDRMKHDAVENVRKRVVKIKGGEGNLPLGGHTDLDQISELLKPVVKEL